MCQDAKIDQEGYNFITHNKRSNCMEMDLNISNNALYHFVSLIYAYENALNGKITLFSVTSSEFNNFLF